METTQEMLRMGEKNSHNRKQLWEDGIKLELRIFGRTGNDLRGTFLRSDTNLSCPICDPIQKELEGPTKDRPAYWNAFASWISLHQHYIIDGVTYKRQTMPHEYNNISYTISTSNYGWNTNRSSNDIHPASPGCRPGTYPLIEEESEEELNASKHRSRVMIIT